MGDVVCPRCGARNAEFNPRCVSCEVQLPPSSTGQSLERDESSSAGASAAGPPEPNLLSPGRMVARYRVLDLLGRGGMGEVYRARDERGGRLVALKLLRPDRSENDEIRERFRREARAAGRLDHPAVVRIYEVLEHEEGDCIVMELVEGRTLADLMGDGRPDLARLVALGRGIAEGLAAAHAEGIVHRDLKAENVMVTADGGVKILDFGLAKRFALGDKETTYTEVSLTVDGGVVGTFRAMSPEQAQGFPVDPRSDLFSFGTLLYEAITGHSPFRRSGLAATLAQLCLHRQPPAVQLNSDVPESLSRLIDALLEKDPALRPQNADEVAAALGDVQRELESQP